jgi:hypothetical protein
MEVKRMEMEYKKWLVIELEKAQKREEEQRTNYQDTGTPRYYNAQINAEYLGRALQTALSVENKRSETNESIKRAILGNLNEISDYIETLPPDLAVQKIREVIRNQKILL